MRRAAAGLIVAAACPLLVAGCASPLPAAPVASTAATVAAERLPVGISVSLLQYRSDRAARGLSIEVRNSSGADFRVLSARFASDAFPAGAVAARGATVPSGVTRDLQVTLPAPDCIASDDARVTIAWHDGAGTREATVHAPDPEQSLKRVLDDDCAGEAITRIAQLTGTGVRVEGSGTESVAHLTVQIAPTGAPGRITVRRIAQTVLLESSAGGDWALGADGEGVGVAGTDAPSALELAITPNRCDPHAVAEDKVGTRLPVEAIDATGAARRFVLPLAPGLKERLLEFVAAHCGFGG